MISGHSSSNSCLTSNLSDSAESTGAQKQPGQGLLKSVKVIRYACLADTCQDGFETWGVARRHMMNDCHIAGKPNRADSQKKANRLVTAQNLEVNFTKAPLPPGNINKTDSKNAFFPPEDAQLRRVPTTSTKKPDYVDSTLKNRFSGKLKTDYAPSEKELVGLVKNYYSEGADSEDRRRNVMSKAIRPTYGHFAFEKFGFGTFSEFSQRHGLDVYRSQNLPAQFDSALTLK